MRLHRNLTPLIWLTRWISLFLLTSSVLASYQQHVLSFDDEATSDSPPPSSETPSSSDPVTPASTPSSPGLTAILIKRITGWNDTVIAKLTGEITPRAPHPFVVQITDENYDRVIHSELDAVQTGWGSDDDTTWVIAVVANDRVSMLFDEVYDDLASNSSLAVNPPPPRKREDEVAVKQLDPSDPFLLKPNIRFGRIDYMGKTDLILTKWLIFKCPVLVVVTKRGSELRFFKTGAVPPKADHLSEFLREARWIYKPVWKSTFSSGGSGEWIVTLMGHLFQGLHTLTDKVPGWALMMISSMLGTSLMQWLHANQVKSQKNAKLAIAKSTPASVNPKALKEELAQAALELAESTRKSRESTVRGDDAQPEGVPTGLSSGISKASPKNRRKAK